jgi:cytochrome c-type biogenesis protein CcmH/NrfG
VALLVTVSIVVVILVILLFAGCKWVKPQLLRLEVANWLKFELRSSEQQEPPEQPNAPSSVRDLVAGLRCWEFL